MKKQTTTGTDLSITIPVYKSEDCIKELYKRLVQTLDATDLKYEIILVEDCGGDNSWSRIQQLAETDSRVRGFKLTKNFGQHNAIAAGLSKAKGDWIVIMDCDLQDRPEVITELLEKAREGHDLIITRSAVPHQESWKKKVLSKFFYKAFTWLSGYSQVGNIRPMRLMTRRVADTIRCMPEQTRTLGPLLEWTGYKATYIQVTTEKRHHGRSSYSWAKSFSLSMRTIIAHSNRPLELSIFAGIFMAACAFTYGSYTFARHVIEEIDVPGWTSLITSIYFIGGLTLANLGIIGIYLGKTFEETKRRPLFVISDTTDESERSTGGNITG